MYCNSETRNLPWHLFALQPFHQNEEMLLYVLRELRKVLRDFPFYGDDEVHTRIYTILGFMSIWQR
jgi:hypothetical protein